MDILILHRQGKSYRVIAKELGISRNTTVKMYGLNPELPAYKLCTAKLTKLEPYKNYIQKRIKAAKPQVDLCDGIVP